MWYDVLLENTTYVIYEFVRGESHIDFRTQCVIMTQITWPPPPKYYMRHLQIFDKIDSFLKNVSNLLDNKKVRLHLGRTAYTTCNCWLAFFFFRCRFQEKIEPSSRNCLIWIADWGGSTIPQTHRIHLLFSYQYLK